MGRQVVFALAFDAGDFARVGELIRPARIAPRLIERLRAGNGALRRV